MLEREGVNTGIDLDRLITIGKCACAFLGRDYNSYVGNFGKYPRY